MYVSQNPQSIIAMACAKDGKITSFFQSSPKDAPLPIRWTARAEPPKKRTKRGPDRQRSDRACCPASEQFPRFRQWSGTRSAGIHGITTYAALDPMYVDVISCSSGHFGCCGTSGTFWHLLTYVSTSAIVYRAHALALL